MHPSILTQNSLKKESIKGKRVLIRLDLDLPTSKSGKIETFRLENSLKTIKFCLKYANQVAIIGHLGRPRGRVVKELSLRPIADTISRLLKHPITFVDNFVKTYSKRGQSLPTEKLLIFENLRFTKAEDSADPSLAKLFKTHFDHYIFDAFAVSHREAVSTTSLPSLLPTSLGFAIQKELASLSTFFSSKSPKVLILGGAKPDKLALLPKLVKSFDLILMGGRLPYLYPKNHKNLIKARLKPNGLDITSSSALEFARHLKKAKFVLFNGPLGKFEDPKYREGTRLTLKGIPRTAMSIAGGGDTESFLDRSPLYKIFRHVSTGGGALLHLFAHGDLPALKAIKKSPIQ